jgi:hypothetical protein
LRLDRASCCSDARHLPPRLHAQCMQLLPMCTTLHPYLLLQSVNDSKSSSPLRSPRLYSIATPLSSLCRRTSRPSSYRPVSPTLPLSRCSQPQGKSTTGAPARAPRRPPSSATANSSSTGHLRLSSPVRHLPKHHRTPGYLTDLSIVVDECSSGPSPALLPAQRALPRIVSSVSPQPPQLLQSGFFHSGVAPHPLPH